MKPPLTHPIHYCKPAVTFSCRNMSGIKSLTTLSIWLFCRSWTSKRHRQNKFHTGYFYKNKTCTTYYKQISKFWHIWCRCSLLVHSNTVCFERHVPENTFRRSLGCLQKDSSTYSSPAELLRKKKNYSDEAILLSREHIFSFLFPCILSLPSHETPSLCKSRRSPAVL